MAKVGIEPGQGHDLHHVAIDVSSGTTELVSAIAGRSIAVVSYALVASAAGTAKFTGSGDLTGAMSFAQNGGIAAPGQPSSPWFQTDAGAALSIVTTAAFKGHLSYTY